MGGRVGKVGCRSWADTVGKRGVKPTKKEENVGFDVMKWFRPDICECGHRLDEHYKGNGDKLICLHRDEEGHIRCNCFKYQKV